MDEKLKIIISAEVGEVKKGCKEAQEEIEKVSKSTGVNGKSMIDSFTKIGNGAKKGLAIAGAALAGVGVALLSTVDATREYREAQAKLSASFESAGMSAQTAKSAYTELYSVIGETDQAVEASQQIALLADSEEEVVKWAELGAGVVGKFGDALQPETFYESANETLKLGEATGAYVQMLEGAGVSVDEFNAKLAACSTESEKQQLLFDTANGILGDAGEAYREAAGGLIEYNEAQAKLDEAMAGIGETLEPIKTNLMELGAGILADLQPYIQEFAEKYLPKILEVLSGVGEVVGEVILFIAENWETISTIAGIILGIATAFSVFSTVMAVVNAVLYACPITWIIMAIVALIAIIALVIIKWDDLKAAVSSAVESIKEWVSDMVDKVVGWFKNLWEDITNIANDIASVVKNAFQSIKDWVTNIVSSIKDWVVEKFNAIKNGISEKISSAKEIVSNLFTNIKDSIKEKISSAKDTVLGIFDSIKNGIQSKIEAAKNFVSGAIEKIKNFFNFDWSLPKIKLPHFSITGKFSLNPPQIPKFSVSWYQRGGVFDSPTLFGYGNGMLGGLGENGAEAVVPLEKNTKWLDKIAERLGAGNNRPIVLQIDGRTFAQISCESINALTRQTGNLPLKLV